MKKVSEEEFKEFVSSYPNGLHRSVALFCEPPVVTFHDFTLGAGLSGLVARHSFTEPGSLIPSDWAVKEAA